jgi:hypothetical protein
MIHVRFWRSTGVAGRQSRNMHGSGAASQACKSTPMVELFLDIGKLVRVCQRYMRTRVLGANQLRYTNPLIYRETRRQYHGKYCECERKNLSNKKEMGNMKGKQANQITDLWTNNFIHTCTDVHE